MTPTIRPLFAAALVAQALLPGHGAAQDYPTDTIQIIVPFPPGGGTDIPARQLADRISRDTGWTFVVVNQPGAGGTIGLDQLSRATPDGLTIGMAQTANMAVSPALNPEVQYDPLTDFTPIVPVASQPMAIIAANDSPYADFGAIMTAATQDPGSVLYATPGSGTVAHMAIERLSQRAGTELDHVPYTGVAQAISDVMGGVVDFYIGSLPSVLPHAQSGSVRLLAVTSAEPYPLTPDVPTVASFGYDGYSAEDWKAVVGPAGLPDDVVQTLNAAINTALEDPDLREALALQGSVAMGGTTEAFAALVADDVAAWSRTIDEAGLTPAR